MSDALYDAAAAWLRMTQYRYNVLLARKGVTSELVLAFAPDDFFHLAGFHYLDDIQLPLRFSRSKALSVVLDGDVAESAVCKSLNYAKVLARLRALAIIEAVLDGEFAAYRFDAKRLQFHSRIQADYIFSSEDGTNLVFVLTSKDKDASTQFCRSIFEAGPDDADYRRGQSRMVVLRKEKEEISTGTRRLLYLREGYSPST